MQAPDFELEANLVDIRARRHRPARVVVAGGRIQAVESVDPRPSATLTFLLPGFVDAHVHVESSMLVPSEFARAAVVHGTVGSVSDPHEIGNVLGTAGVTYMLENAAGIPFKFCFGAPSCVPATTFETAGAEISTADVQRLLDDPRIGYLSEMMNYPGVLAGDEQCLAKIVSAQQRGKPIDGHAPGLRGDQARQYVAAGMSTDHECFTKEEALDKIAAGAKIAIREGSAARNFEALHSLLREYPQATMLCSDDKHPDELLAGHIDQLVRRAVERDIDLYDALQAACVNPVEHYAMDVGLLRVGDPADFIEVDSLESLRVLRTWVDGILVAANGKSLIERRIPQVVNRFTPRQVRPDEIRVPAAEGKLNVIDAIDGQLVTKRLEVSPTVVDGQLVSDPQRDILKLVVVNRYQSAPPAVAFIKNFGLQRGAIASSVAHDSHNVIAVGVDDDDIVAAIELVMQSAGGLSLASSADNMNNVLALPVAGLMSTESCVDVGRAYAELDAGVKRLGSRLRAPYMTLSFMALLVIPEIKLSDRGLFDGDTFRFLPLIAQA